jgi:hypothetical protein
MDDVKEKLVFSEWIDNIHILLENIFIWTSFRNRLCPVSQLCGLHGVYNDNFVVNYGYWPRYIFSGTWFMWKVRNSRGHHQKLLKQSLFLLYLDNLAINMTSQYTWKFCSLIFIVYIILFKYLISNLSEIRCLLYLFFFDLDLWPWKSIGFHILLRTKYVPSLVKIHWRILILECSQGCCAVKIWPGDLDLWPWKSIGFHILLRTKYVPSLVKIHWRMLILECSQGCNQTWYILSP